MPAMFTNQDAAVFELRTKLAQVTAERDRARDTAVDHIETCDLAHGGEGNTAKVYGHHASVRICIRLYGTDTWVYDPRWEMNR